MKLFKVAQKRTEGKCNAMRCTEEITVTGCEYINGDGVDLCQKHYQDLERYKAANPKPDQPSQPAEIVQEGDSLESILISNLAVKSGAVESREENAKDMHEIALAIKIGDITTRDKADLLLSLVHEEEKALKSEVAAMYKPVKDAAKATKMRLDSWFGPTLAFYTEAKAALKEKIGNFIRHEKAKEDVALSAGDHDAAAKCATEASKNVRLKRTYGYRIQNEGKNLPNEFLIPDIAQSDAIVKLLPRKLLVPNYDLLDKIVKEHGNQLEIPDVKITLQEDVQMKGKRS